VTCLPNGYGDYLQLAQVLSAQHPRSGGCDSQTFRSEHFFIVAHQCTELWTKQILLDCAAAEDDMTSPDGMLDRAQRNLLRVAAVLDLMTAHARVLVQLSPVEFAQLRHHFGGASGAQSQQLRRFFAYVGVPHGTGSLLVAYRHALSHRGMTLHDVYCKTHGSEPLATLTDALLAIAESTWEWQLAHTRIAYRMLGSTPGTGRTQGVDHLLRRAAIPFQELWDARSFLHDDAVPSTTSSPRP
jgi:tryptophan 2,3-dioxygenase